jgi:hypothetical protein
MLPVGLEPALDLIPGIAVDGLPRLKSSRKPQGEAVSISIYSCRVRNDVGRRTLCARICLQAQWEIRMIKKFDPAPFDKHAADPKEALNVDFIVDGELDAGLVGGSFPASDPPSASQPSPSKYDKGRES